MMLGSIELNCPPMATRGRAIRGYQDLEVWKRAMNLVVESYSATRAFPPDERYGLKAQIRRSAVSIPSNIAEGRGRQGLGGFMYHLSVANGSLMELETQFLIATRYPVPGTTNVGIQAAGDGSSMPPPPVGQVTARSCPVDWAWAYQRRLGGPDSPQRPRCRTRTATPSPACRSRHTAARPSPDDSRGGSRL